MTTYIIIFVVIIIVLIVAYFYLRKKPVEIISVAFTTPPVKIYADGKITATENDKEIQLTQLQVKDIAPLFDVVNKRMANPSTKPGMDLVVTTKSGVYKVNTGSDDELSPNEQEYMKKLGETIFGEAMKRQQEAAQQ